MGGALVRAQDDRRVMKGIFMKGAPWFICRALCEYAPTRPTTSIARAEAP